ncbi:uncharacterized protein LOC126482073 [Schistocerca serialis cubense]|uniref:uncharacterized protein LOC126482073 n=1 Tax=Schistocerca serialis cubense TaxID=2023355 RepID=UPI00214E219F|nr:uncharacterized protein LOC126482073 [Schistocerca serialis cubense]
MCRSVSRWWGPLIPAGGAPRAGSPRPASAPASSASAMYPLASARQPEARKPARRFRCPALAAAAVVGCLVLVSFAVVAFTLSHVLDVRPFQEAARSTESALLEEAAIVAEVAGPPPGAGSTNGTHSAVLRPTPGMETQQLSSAPAKRTRESSAPSTSSTPDPMIAESAVASPATSSASPAAPRHRASDVHPPSLGALFGRDVVSGATARRLDLGVTLPRHTPTPAPLLTAAPPVTDEVVDDQEEVEIESPDFEDQEPGDEQDWAVMSLLRERVPQLQGWLATWDAPALLTDVLSSLHGSLTSGDPGVLLSRLRLLHAQHAPSHAEASRVVANASSPVSAALLAVDLLLLRNLLAVAWEDQPRVAAQLFQQPDVWAVQTLFEPPELVRQGPARAAASASALEADANRTVVRELLDMAASGARAVSTLLDAYRTGNGRALDCMWAAYCHALDASAHRLRGLPGLIARVNSVGLRLMMGEFPLEQALQAMFVEAATGWSHIDCPALFPRCSAEAARHVLIQTALGERSSSVEVEDASSAQLRNVTES